MKTRILAVITLGIALNPIAHAATNSWIDGSVKWEAGADWSGGATNFPARYYRARVVP
jgi:hypothetical protein